MCGILGIVGQPNSHVNQLLYDGLTVLQHRGQDAAGILTDTGGHFRLRKSNGLVSDVFYKRHMLRLEGNVGIGHVRYPTAGSSSRAEAQPFYVNSPYGIALAHNGNLTNAEELGRYLRNECMRHVNTTSDSELLLNALAVELGQRSTALNIQGDPHMNIETVFGAVGAVNDRVRGGYACVSLIAGYGLLAFRDPNGIRPLVYGKREIEGQTEYIVASESVAITALGFEIVRDVRPGEAIFISSSGHVFTRQCSKPAGYTPCIFEHVYFARPDSVIDGMSVYQSRLNQGQRLAERLMESGRTTTSTWSSPSPTPEGLLLFRWPRPSMSLTEKVSSKTATSVVRSSCRVRPCVKNRFVASSTPLRTNSEGRTSCSWTTQLCAAPPALRSLKWPGKLAPQSVLCIGRTSGSSSKRLRD